MNVRHAATSARTRRRARGQAMIEMTVNILMFALMLTVITSLSAYLYVQQAIVTAAREGARVASLSQEIGDPTTSLSGIAAVKSHVTDMVRRTTGLTLAENDIDVEPPDPSLPVGDRSVDVTLDFSVPNPLPIEPMLAAFGGGSYGLSEFPLHAQATMRYEE